MNTVKREYLKDYPRPQLYREGWESLNGSWDFSFDHENIGEDAGWYNNFPMNHQILVPFSYETPKSGIGDTSIHSSVWYHRELCISSEKGKNSQVILHFEGVDYITKVWVNGNYVDSHYEGYSRFSANISSFLKDGTNHLVVKVEDSLSEYQPRGKQRWLEKSYECWYVQTTGIWKTVWLEYVPKTCIDSLKLTPCLVERSLALETSIKQYGIFCDELATDETTSTSEMLYLDVEITLENVLINQCLISVSNNQVSQEIALYNTSVYEWGIRTWSPEHPFLYDIKLTLRKGTTVIDQVRSYFGMREITIENSTILLNGMPFYQKLILDQGYWHDSHLTPPDAEAFLTDINAAKSLGFNGIRKHQKIEDEQFYYWCDVLGMVVWCEFPSPYLFGINTMKAITNQWTDVVCQLYNHPSIITWVPFNESWGIPYVKNNTAQQSFVQSIYYLTKALDPLRPVVTNDGWEHTKTDIITIHDYETDASAFSQRYKAYSLDTLDSFHYPNKIRSLMANGFHYSGQPVILSEFGGIALQTSESQQWGYGKSAENEDSFLKRFSAITSAVESIPYLSGYCYTQLTDVQQEVNGLLNENRELKIATLNLPE